MLSLGIAYASIALLSLIRNFPHRHGAGCSIDIATNGHGSLFRQFGIVETSFTLLSLLR